MKALLLISSGIDSPVAGHLMKKQGLEVIGMYCDNRPYGDDVSLEKVKRLCKKIGISKLYVVKHGECNLKDIVEKTNRQYTCILCKRFMFRVAEKVAEKDGCKTIITGDNLGQVASQTLDNMKVITEAVKMIVLRPLLCNDKNETMKLAREIGTYDISIEKSMGCSAVPRNPKTRSKIEKVKYLESKIDVEDMVKHSVESVEVFSL